MEIKVFVPTKDPHEGVTGEIYLDNSYGSTLSEKIKAMSAWDADWYIFRHDDLEILRPLMGAIPQFEQFGRDNVGVAGLIGTMCLHTSCQWWQPLRPVVTAGGIIQGFADGRPDSPMLDCPGYRTDMASVDGCFLAFSRDFLEKFEPHPIHWRFCYDVDACLQCLEMGKKVGILDLQCRHQSEGKFDPREFEDARQKFLAYWKPRVDFPVISQSKFRSV